MNPPQADYSYWDTVPSFTMTEAAWLWCGLEPPDSGREWMPKLGKGITPHPTIPGLPAKGQRYARAMWTDIRQGRLVILTEPPDTRYLIPRVCLRAWADKRGEFPRFLFPDLPTIAPPRPKKRRESSRSEEWNRWKECADGINKDRKVEGKPPLNKSGLATEVIEKLGLPDAPRTVREKL